MQPINAAGVTIARPIYYRLNGRVASAVIEIPSTHGITVDSKYTCTVNGVSGIHALFYNVF